MNCAFKTTVKFTAADASTLRVQYAISARTLIEARDELERRFTEQEIFGYEIEQIIAAGMREMEILRLPVGGMQLLGC
jgi:hypothetical protein